MDLTVSDLRSLNVLVKEKFNYDFSNYAFSSYKRRISRLMEMKRTITVNEFVYKIQKGEITKEDFLSEVTVNVTEMYRDPSFWEHFREKVQQFSLSNHFIKIWHAGCSSGEEVFSMLILLKEIGLLERAEIIATDIDKKILARAKDGKIAKKNMAANRANYEMSGGKTDLLKYFDEQNDYYSLDKSLLDKVKFSELDLVQSPAFPTAHFILCRNVFIYFNQVLQNAVLVKLHSTLEMGGFLVLGSKESLTSFDTASKFMAVTPDERIYKKTKD